MRKVIFLIHVSLDGFVAGPNGEMDWMVYNDEVEQYSHDLHATTDAAIYGRVTYEMMNGYWPTVLSNPDSAEGDRAHARWYENATKIVISKTWKADPAKKEIVLGENIEDEITRIKAQSGKNLWLLGSPAAAQTLIRLNLIDEYRLNVNPVILGSGKPLFAHDESKLNLKLIEAKTFKGGVVALRYEPERK